MQRGEPFGAELREAADPPASRADDLEICPLRWHTLRSGVPLGFVMLADRKLGYFKVYVGLGAGANPDVDAGAIAGWGTPILDEPVARLLAGVRAEGLRYAR